MKTLWIRGITLTLFPTHEFMQKTDFSTKMVGVVSVEQEMEKKTEPLV